MLILQTRNIGLLPQLTILPKQKAHKRNPADKNTNNCYTTVWVRSFLLKNSLKNKTNHSLVCSVSHSVTHIHSAHSSDKLY